MTAWGGERASALHPEPDVEVDDRRQRGFERVSAPVRSAKLRRSSSMQASSTVPFGSEQEYPALTLTTEVLMNSSLRAVSTLSSTSFNERVMKIGTVVSRRRSA